MVSVVGEAIGDREWIPLWGLVSLAEAALKRGATEAAVAGAWGIGVDELRGHLERSARGHRRIVDDEQATILGRSQWVQDATTDERLRPPDRKAIAAILRRVSDRAEAAGFRAEWSRLWSRKDGSLAESVSMSPGLGSVPIWFILRVGLHVQSVVRDDPEHPAAWFPVTDGLGEPVSTYFRYDDACSGGSGALRIVRWDRTEEGDEALASLDAGLTWLLGIPERMREHGLDHIDVNNAKLRVRRRFQSLQAPTPLSIAAESA